MRFLKRALPFLLTLIVGVSLAWVARFQWKGANRKTATALAAPLMSHERTWLVVRAQPAPVFGTEFFPADYQSSAVVRVRLAADRTVPGVVFEQNSMSAPAVEAIADAMRGIRFSPPTEDGRPLAVTAEADCDIHAIAMGEYFDTKGAKRSFRNFALGCSRLRIIAVEGAREPEGWRIVYE
jgi:hypothetical protein